jgi:flagellin-specific chaperone FliS
MKSHINVYSENASNNFSPIETISALLDSSVMLLEKLDEFFKKRDSENFHNNMKHVANGFSLLHSFLDAVEDKEVVSRLLEVFHVLHDVTFGMSVLDLSRIKSENLEKVIAVTKNVRDGFKIFLNDAK